MYLHTRRNPNSSSILASDLNAPFSEEEQAMRTADANKAWERGDITTLRNFCLNAVLRCRELDTNVDRLQREYSSFRQDSDAEIAALRHENATLRLRSGTAASTQPPHGPNQGWGGRDGTGPPGSSAYPRSASSGNPQTGYRHRDFVS
ncbi:uncharacterized protein L203_105219 [Cryptococcus depauperatus CBS 7841]|uniref:Uncharacterized protein n=1 Tax=Cryptococcus depauperatus CBS 7841 TaxID=1295531 RepID=A0AAJ8JX75_9TREE